MSRCPSDCRIHQIQAQRHRRERRKPTKLEGKEKPFPVIMETQIPKCPTFEEKNRVTQAVFPVSQVRATTTVSQRLAEAASKDQITRTFKQIVPSHYHRFERVFLKESFDELPVHKKWDHVIELVPGAKEFSTKLYAMSPTEQGELDQFLEENLKSGQIRPSKSPMASPVFYIKKKDGSLRFVQDYCKLNSITIRN
jgi:hypothetical protein